MGIRILLPGVLLFGVKPSFCNFRLSDDRSFLGTPESACEQRAYWSTGESQPPARRSTRVAGRRGSLVSVERGQPPGVPCWLPVLPHKSPFAKGVRRCLSSRATSATTAKLPAAADVGVKERGKELPLAEDGHCGRARGEDCTERSLEGGLGVTNSPSHSAWNFVGIRVKGSCLQTGNAPQTHELRVQSCLRCHWYLP